MTKRSRAALLSATLALSALLSQAAPRPAKSWTIMVYMMAENDLEESAIADLEEMSAAGAGSSFDIVVLADRGSLYTAAALPGIPPWKGAKRLQAGKGRFSELADWGPTDMGDPAKLERFISETVKSHPAECFALIFWDHGGAWKGFGADESGTPLDPGELYSGISRGLAKAGIEKLDLIGFDSCLMASFEIMSRLRDLASFYLASEELEPDHGWDYRSLSRLGSSAATGPRELGAAMIEGYLAQAKANKEGERVTLSLVDLGAIPRLEKSLVDFAKLVQGDSSSLAADLGRGAGKALAYGKAGSPEQDAAMVDLGALVEAAAKENPALERSRAALASALSKAVVEKGSGSLLKASSGIAVYFPTRRKYYDADYEASGHKAWRTLLESCFAQGEKGSGAAAPRFEATDNEGEASFEEDGAYLAGKLAPGTAAGIVEASFCFGAIDGDSAILLGDDEAYFDPETGEMYGFWDRSVLILRQDGMETYGYLSLSENEGGDLIYSIPFAYFKGGNIEEEEGDYAYIDLVVDEEGEILSSAIYKENDEGMVSPLRPARGSKLVPLVELLTTEGESSMEMTEDWGFDARRWEEIELDYSEIDPDVEVYLELSAADAGEGYDYVYYSGPMR